MGADRHWLSVELAEGGDPEAVRDAMDYQDSRIDYCVRHGDALVFVGIEYRTDRVVDALNAVAESVAAVALFHHYDGAGGMLAAYYETDDGELTEIERLSHDAMGTMTEPVFDYFSAKYGIYAPV
ncbi:hypothetical protein [Halorientalis pallida]|uniref:Uncharacterized protein n=1 Tax=Halorientalis pallida TaxID=2479928 RepID=A0A498KZD9_9EURY|nr:hypothetical protein [Halorientalis pallida]RXK48556.1 hypothetical protein EAF64_12825 [Halorientalis pallida]